ncbi:MAG: hypothetical protein J6Y62_07210 [Clostridia bacterium]|nr:hypothetical protein [Clostridia bacterium]
MSDWERESFSSVWENFKQFLCVAGVIGLFTLVFVIGVVVGVDHLERKIRDRGMLCDFCGQRKKSFRVFIAEKEYVSYEGNRKSQSMELWACDDCCDEGAEKTLMKLTKKRK